MRASLTRRSSQLLDDAGAVLAASTAGDCRGGEARVARSATTLLLAYLPTVLDPAAPELKRANLPVGWATPAFDVLQMRGL